MSIISVRDNESNRWKRNANKQKKKAKTEKNKGDKSYSGRVKAEWFCCAFKFGFLQLICKASLIFKLNLELALSIIFKKRELCKSKYVVVESRCLVIWDFLSFLIYPFLYYDNIASYEILEKIYISLWRNLIKQMELSS